MRKAEQLIEEVKAINQFLKSNRAYYCHSEVKDIITKLVASHTKKIQELNTTIAELTKKLQQ